MGGALRPVPTAHGLPSLPSPGNDRKRAGHRTDAPRIARDGGSVFPPSPWLGEEVERRSGRRRHRSRPSCRSLQIFGALPAPYGGPPGPPTPPTPTPSSASASSPGPVFSSRFGLMSAPRAVGGQTVRRSGDPAVRQSPSDEALAGREERRTASAARRWTRGGSFRSLAALDPRPPGSSGGGTGSSQPRAAAHRGRWRPRHRVPAEGPGLPPFPPGGFAAGAGAHRTGAGPRRPRPRPPGAAPPGGAAGSPGAAPCGAPQPRGPREGGGSWGQGSSLPCLFFYGSRWTSSGRRGAKARQEKKGRQRCS